MKKTKLLSLSLVLSTVICGFAAKALVLMPSRQVNCESDIGMCEGLSYSADEDTLPYSCQCYEDDRFKGFYEEQRPYPDLAGMSDELLLADCELVLANCADVEMILAVEISEVEQGFDVYCATEFGECDWFIPNGDWENLTLGCECTGASELGFDGIGLDVNKDLAASYSARQLSYDCVTSVMACGSGASENETDAELDTDETDIDVPETSSSDTDADEASVEEEDDKDDGDDQSNNSEIAAGERDSSTDASNCAMARSAGSRPASLWQLIAF